MKFPSFKNETQKIEEGFRFVAGCDEVGIGPLAGPVVAATVILDPASINGYRSKTKWWYRVRDSKTVSETEREELEKFIRDHSVDFAVAVVPHETIDEINIYQAARLAMKNSVDGMKQQPDFLFLDGPRNLTTVHINQQPVIDGDAKILSISCASIIAKVARDKILSELHDVYPQYGFVKHKGYGTRFHRDALKKFGICPEHRKSFSFIQEILKQPVASN